MLLILRKHGLKRVHVPTQSQASAYTYYQCHRFCTFKMQSNGAVYTLRKNELLTKTVTMTVHVNEPSLFQLSSTKKKVVHSPH